MVFVLVHGAFGGGWCWQWVVPALEAAHHRVLAPTLMGLGDRVHLATPALDLDTHIDELVELLRVEDLRHIILVGWSYGGMVVAGVADRLPERIAHLVYLDADVPRDGDTSVPPSRLAQRQELARLHGDGWLVPAAALGADDLLLRELAADRQDELRARLVPHPLATWTQPIRLSGAGSRLPTTYIRCLDGYDPTDVDTRRQDERLRSEPAWSYVELTASHAAPLSAPDVVAAALLAIARTARPEKEKSPLG